MLRTSSVIYLVTPLLWLVKTPTDMNHVNYCKQNNYGNVGNTPRVSHFSASLELGITLFSTFSKQHSVHFQNGLIVTSVSSASGQTPVPHHLPQVNY